MALPCWGWAPRGPRRGSGAEPPARQTVGSEEYRRRCDGCGVGCAGCGVGAKGWGRCDGCRVGATAVGSASTTRSHRAAISRRGGPRCRRALVRRTDQVFWTKVTPSPMGRSTTRIRGSAATCSLKARIATVASSVAWGSTTRPPCRVLSASRRPPRRKRDELLVVAEIAALVEHQRTPGRTARLPARTAGFRGPGPGAAQCGPRRRPDSSIPGRWRSTLRSYRSTAGDPPAPSRGPPPGRNSR